VFNKIAESNEPAKGLGRRGVLGLQADAPVKNTNKTRYNSRSQKVETGLVEG
jgi:hypothetical protein